MCKTLTEVQNDNKPLVEAIHDYEVEMLRYSTEAVLESRKQMNANDLIHKPVLGRVQLAAMRGGMRVVNAIPALKKRITDNVLRVRGAIDLTEALDMATQGGRAPAYMLAVFAEFERDIKRN